MEPELVEEKYNLALEFNKIDI